MKKILGILLGTLLASSSFAATTPNSFITPQTPNRGYVQFNGGVGQGSLQTLYTAGANGSRCYSVTASSTDNAGHNVTMQISAGANPAYSVSVLVPASAGSPPTAGGPTIPLMTPSLTTGFPVDQYGNQYMQLISGDTLKVAYFTAIGTGFVFLYAMCSDY